MANYIAHYTRKKQILARKEDAMRRLVAKNGPQEKLIAAAEGIRDARISVLRAGRAVIVPKDNAMEQYEILDAKIQALAETSVAAILTEFGHTLDMGSD